MNFKLVASRNKLPLFFVIILLMGMSIDSGELSSFVLLDGTPQFSSSSLDRNKWSSMTREYCFVKKELSFELMYELSPMPLPAFKVINSVSDIYISVDLDELNRVRFQKLIDAWKSVAQLGANEKICFRGAYLPPDTPAGAIHLVIDEIESKNLRVAAKDFLLEESNLD